MKPFRSHSLIEAAALLTVPVVGGFLIWMCWPLRLAIQQNSQGSAAILSKVGTALDTINRPKSGTLSMLDDTILQGRLTIDATNKVLIHEQNQLGTLDTDIALLSTHTDATLTALSGTAASASQSLQTISQHAASTLDATTTALGSANERIKGLADTQTRMNSVLAAFDARLEDPNLAKTEANVQEATAQAAIIAKDAKVEEQKYVYPPKTPWYNKIVPITLKAGELAYDFIR